ncbi:CDP-alcohol phosphatidyltransferase-domain-containing protein [Pholiota molesta]|nr:CDP-alcohol phosphatidyltransferase-domain-containing protein [Pholiota molesta]
MLKTPVIRSLRACKLSNFSYHPSANRYTALFQCTSCIKKYPRVVVAPRFFTTSHARHLPSPPTEPAPTKATIRENIYTIPNLLTVSRILACPVLGWSILDGNYYLATGLLVYAGLTDLADGWLARQYKMSSVLGTILDPAADKTLMTTLTITLAMQDLIPMPLAVIILGRDVLLIISAFYIRYSTLPHPKTFSRYWDFSLPSAEVRPTTISKVNTALQLVLMGTTTVTPILPIDIGLPLQGLQWLVATTTIWSGMSYLFNKNAVRIITQAKSDKPKSP